MKLRTITRYLIKHLASARQFAQWAVDAKSEDCRASFDRDYRLHRNYAVKWLRWVPAAGSGAR